MTLLPSKYPNGCTDDELNVAIQNISDHIQKSGPDINTVMHWSPFVELGISEFQRRAIVSLNEQIMELRKANDSSSRIVTKMTKISVIIGLVSVGLTIISSFLAYKAVMISLNSDKTSSEWQRQQIPILKEIQEKL